MKYITFTIPCYNSENYMRRCVDSLLVGGEDVEILIIDDGSSDRTGAIADEYEMLYPNIVKAVHKPNGGHGSGVNRGLELAHGLYYKVVDSDDWFDRDAYLKMLDKIKSFEIASEDAQIREGETSPPKRYNSGTIILAMENAGQLIEDEELRAQIKGSGIGTSATRAEILKKLVNIKYLALNRKTQIITPTLMGEMIYEVVNQSIRPLLDPKLTASWEKGLTGVADSSISSREYLDKLEGYVTRRTLAVKQVNNQYMLRPYFDYAASFYK